MPDQRYFKFPSTPYLSISAYGISRDDKILAPAEENILFSSIISVEEKIDGANLGISFGSNGNILVQNRGQYLTSPYDGQWRKLSHWLIYHQDALFDTLENKYILFGEWCYAQHSLYYSHLPNWFIGFDVYDKQVHRFLSVSRRNVILQKVKLPTVPLIKRGKISLADIPNLLHTSAYGDCDSEGLYLRLDNADWLELRAKYVRKDFSQSIDLHWRKGLLQKNDLAYNQSFG